MRRLLLVGTALFIAAPAAAQPDPKPPVDEEIVRSLPHPGEIEAVADTVERVTDALMDVPIGPVIDAVDPHRRHTRRGREETIGELATRNDPHARERVRETIGAATVGVGAVAEQIAVVTPVLLRSLEEAAARMDEAMRNGRARRDRDYHREYERNRKDGGR